MNIDSVFYTFILVSLKILTVRTEDGFLTFLIDNSGSMNSIIDAVKKGTQDLMRSVTSSSKNKNFLLMSYDGYYSTRTWINTRDPSALDQALEDIGNDYGPSDDRPPLLFALEQSPPNSDIYVFTDEDWNYDYSFAKPIIDMCRTKRTKVHFVLINRCFVGDNSDCEPYRDIDKDCGGSMKHISGASDISKVLNTVIEKIEDGAKERAPVTSITEGPHVEVPYNGTLQLTCTVTAYPNADVTWSNDLGRVSFQLNQSCPLGSPNNYTSNLTSRITSGGTYVCTAKNSIGTHQSTTIVTVLSPFIVEVAPPETSNANYSKEATIQCKISSSSLMRIDWFRKLNLYSLQLNTSGEYIISSDGTELKINSVNLDSAGQYTCKAVLINDPSQHKEYTTHVKITDLEPPAVDKNIINMHVAKGTNTTLNCKIIKGIPIPKIRWYFKQQSTNVFLYIGETTDGIKVNNVHPNGTGAYKCEAINELGKDVHVINLVVEYPPLIEERKTEIKAMVNETIRLTCNVDGNPTPKVTWIKDGQILLKSKNKKRVKRYHNIQLKASAEVRGTYECKAENKLGVATNFINVDVYVRPKLQRVPDSVQVLLGSSTNLTCGISEGNPKPEMQWYFKQKNQHEFINLGISREIFEIIDADSDVSGTYRCVAHNSIGEDTYDIDVEIEYLPSIENNVTKITEKAGVELKIPCNAIGIPEPAVTWYKNGEVVSRKKTLKIWTLEIDDEGNYTCVATNKHGSANKTIDIYVYIPVSIVPPQKIAVETTKGNNVTLFCTTDGYPKPTVKWMFQSLDKSTSPKILLTNDGTALALPQIQLNEEGFYRCTATNYASSFNITHLVKVYDPARILRYPEQTDAASGNTYDNLSPVRGDFIIMEAVSGDASLTLPCKATGKPSPSVTWIKDGENIVIDSNFYDIVDNGTLIIKSIDEHSAGSYVCFAHNHIGNDTQNYEVLVKAYPEEKSPNLFILIEEGDSVPIECEVPHNELDQLRWFKDQRMVASGELTLNATVADSGTYICRVTSHNESHNEVIEIMVGTKPRFLYNKTDNVDIKVGYMAHLSCEANGVPTPEIKWWYNGIEIKSSDFMTHKFEMKNNDEGRYECEAANDFEKIYRVFTFVSHDCYLNVEMDNYPRLLGSDNSEISKGHLYLPKGEYVTMYCYNEFISFPQQYITASCEKGESLIVGNKSYKYADFKCKEKTEPDVINTGRNCMPGNNEIIEVSYTENNTELSLYEVCFDKDKKLPIYVKNIMDHSLAGFEVNPIKWIDSDLLPFDFETLYDCKLQMRIISSTLERSIHKEDDRCFIKRQLVGPRDVLPGLPQQATFNNLVAVPQWSRYSVQNWDVLENRVRSLAKSVTHKFIVWTGTARQLRLHTRWGTTRKISFRDRNNKQQAVPLYLWKVIQDPVSEASLAVIQLNSPDISPAQAFESMPCKDILCSNIQWMQGSNWHDVSRGFTFCCTLKDFKEAFMFDDLFKNYNRVLYKA